MNNTLNIGKVSIEECTELKNLIERKMGIIEFSKNASNMDTELYEHMVVDLGNTEFLIKDWWSRMYASYKLETIPGTNTRIDFETGDIVAVIPSKNADVQVV